MAKSHKQAKSAAIVKAIIRNPKTTSDARHAIVEHHELDHSFADIAARDMGLSGWL